MNFTVALFERRAGGSFECVTLGLGPHTRRRGGRNLQKVHTGIADELRAVIAGLKAQDVRRFQMARGTRVEGVRLELSLGGGGALRRKVSGVYPIVVEPRWASADERLHVAYHPLRQEDALPVKPDVPLADQLRPHLGRAWAGLADGELEGLGTRGRERLDVLSFSCDHRSLLEELAPERDERDRERGPRQRRGMRVLPQLGENLSARAARGDLDAGVPRSPYRERLQVLLGGEGRPVVVVGPPGSGRSTLVHRAVADLLDADGYPAHRNLDRVRPVFRVSGRRIIAGMSHLGEWEQRCVEILEDARARDVILVVDDLAQLGTIGRSRESARSLADFFRAPLARRELVMIGECTPEELRRLEQEAPSFAALFMPLHVAAASTPETLRLLIREVRALERRHHVEVGPHALRAVIELSGSLLSARAFPGKALDVIRDLGRAREGSAAAPSAVEARDVLALLSQKTGVPETLLRGEEKLDPASVEEVLGRQVMGQDEAVKVAADLVCRVKAGLVDPRRPYGVFLFTGPTGTGKTELAKCLAEYLYGSAARMLRFDMSELAGPDAPARLIGHRWRPEGLLTQRVMEQPFSLVLLDEIEKAHPSVLHLLLQLFEDARLTDAAGRTAHFEHAVIVMTSNLGARPRAAVGFEQGADAVLHDIARAVREFFPPELFNRIDRIVPFRPLTAAIAARVAEKELTKLCRRRGLAERSVFVDVGAGVAERVAREAFVARDGARSVKRFIEDRIGSPLTDAITRGAPAAMQILRVSVEGDGFAVAREVLAEAPPAYARWALEPLVDLPIARLKEKLTELSGFVGGLDAGGELGRLSERIRHHLAQQGEREHAEAVYNLDAMRATVHAFGARVEELSRRDAADDHELIEAQRFGWATLTGWDRGAPEQRIRLFRRAQMPPPVRHVRKGEALEHLAEGFALRRALARVDEPGQHAIFVDLSRAADLGDPGRFAQPAAGMLERLAAIYAQARGEVEAHAVRSGDGRVRERAGPVWHTDLVDEPAARVVLKIVGLCVRDFFELEEGAHVWTSLARGPEVVRVRVSAALPGETPGAVLERPIVEPVPPVVRKIRFDPPRDGEAAPIEIEDYVMGWAETVRARRLSEALAPLWLLRLSREDVS